MQRQGVVDIESGGLRRPSAAEPASAHAFWRAATSSDYFGWLHHTTAASGCTHPVRLSGDIATVELGTGRIISTTSTQDMPEGVIYKLDRDGPWKSRPDVQRRPHLGPPKSNAGRRTVTIPTEIRPDVLAHLRDFTNGPPGRVGLHRRQGRAAAPAEFSACREVDADRLGRGLAGFPLP
jgi:hypothetical protein